MNDTEARKIHTNEERHTIEQKIATDMNWSTKSQNWRTIDTDIMYSRKLQKTILKKSRDWMNWNRLFWLLLKRTAKCDILWMMNDSETSFIQWMTQIVQSLKTSIFSWKDFHNLYIESTSYEKSTISVLFFLSIIRTIIDCSSRCCAEHLCFSSNICFHRSNAVDFFRKIHCLSACDWINFIFNSQIWKFFEYYRNWIVSNHFNFVEWTFFCI